MPELKEELAIIKNIHVGMRDFSSPCCFFTVQTRDYESLQIISLESMRQMIIDGSVYKLEDLNGKPCIVTIDGNGCGGTYKYKRLRN